MEGSQLDLFSELDNDLRQMPKVDLHRHLSASVRFTTLYELAEASSLQLPATNAVELEKLMAVRSPVTSLGAFVAPRRTIRPWNILHQLMTTPEIVSRLVFEAVEDAATDGVTYVEFRVSPYGVLNYSKMSLSDFLNALKHGLAAAFDQFHTVGVIVLSLARHHLVRLSPSERNRYYDKLLSTVREFHGDCVVGFDLSGVEQAAPPHLFQEFFQEVKKLGFGITIHAGEGGSPKNIWQAITILGATRIGHGVVLNRDPEILQLARSQEVTFEQCITSNLMTGVVKNIKDHPLPQLLQAGIKVVLCTDDPTLMGISLTSEYKLAHVALGISIDQLQQMGRYAHLAKFKGIE